MECDSLFGTRSCGSSRPNQLFLVEPDVGKIRPDILDGVCTLGNRLMDEEHGLSPVTKALIASYVSKVNACAY